MPILRGASLCAFASLFLFSCSTETKNKIPEKELPVVNSPAGQTFSKEAIDINALNTKFIESITQHFSVPAKHTTVLTAKGGMKITVDPSMLEKEDGKSMNGNIEVRIVELTNVNDLFRSNAATISDGKLLASGGSYFIGMENGGSKVRIKKGEALEAAFPMLKKEDMELFYGQRNQNNDMNWKPTNVVFTKQYQSIDFNGDQRTEINPGQLEELIEPRIYKSLEETVYYYGSRTTLQKLVDTLNKNSQKVYLQTISYWPKDLPKDKVLDTNYLTRLYGPRKQYLLKSCKEEERKKQAMANWQPKTLAGQIQKNYAPTSITTLGWINCDRFYEVPEKVETNVDIPYAFNDSRVEYFILFKRFNGLLKGTADIDKTTKMVLADMPAGQDITLIAFTKKNGIVYQAKQDFTIKKDKSIPIDFKEITAVELNKIFGSNVKI